MPQGLKASDFLNLYQSEQNPKAKGLNDIRRIAGVFHDLLEVTLPHGWMLFLELLGRGRIRICMSRGNPAP
jgi:hypothetical protein